jgi:SulP family sulfate permease
MGIGVAAVAVGVSTPVLSAIPLAMPSVGLPDFGALPLSALLSDALALALLSSLDSLLCAAGMDARMGGPRTRVEQELVAQGLANMASACVGAMPVAGAIVRSMAAYEAGATTRLAPIVQSLVLALVLVLLTPYLPFVPIAALAAILLVVGCRLIDWRGLARTYAASRSEALVFVATTAAILATDFVKGVGVGVVLAIADFARRSSRLSVSADVAAAATPALVVRLEGALFFGSHAGVERVAAEADGAPEIVIDVSGVRDADITGATSLARVVAEIVSRGRSVWIAGARSTVRPALEAAGLAAHLVPSEAEALRAAPAGSSAHAETAKEHRGASRRPQLSHRLQPSLE